MKNKNIIYGVIGIVVLLLVGMIVLNSGKKNQIKTSNQSSASQATGNQLTAVDSISHAHGLSEDVADGSKVYVATHHGLLVLQNDKTLSRIGNVEDDLMGFSVHPTNPQIYFSSGHPQTGGNLGFQKSEDGGFTWKKISDGMSGPVDYHAMIVSPANPNVIYGNYMGGLQRTTNEGKNWEVVTSANFPITNLAADPKDENTIYAASQQGLMISSDKGETWSKLLNGFVTAISVHPENSQILLSYSQIQQLAKSSDGGKTWGKIDSNFGGETPLYISFNKQQPEIIYLLTDKNSIYKSNDEGNTWNKIR